MVCRERKRPEACTIDQRPVRYLVLPFRAQPTRMDGRARSRLREADWADIGIRLTAYAVWKARNYRWRTGEAAVLAAGNTPEDVARDAIVKVLDGTRAWDPARGPLFPFLQRVVDSLMSHLAASSDNAVLERWHDTVAEPGAADSPAGSDRCAVLIEALRATLEAAGASDLVAVLDAAQVHGPRPRAIATALGTSVEDIYNRLKRIRRAALRVGQAGARYREA